MITLALVTLREVLAQAEAGGYAVPAINVHTLEVLPAVLQVAAEERSPIILQFTEGTLKFCGYDNVRVFAGHLARVAPVPVVLHQDHGASYAVAVRAIQAGFTSVMIDASRLPLEENIAATRKVVELAHACGVSVEAELGRVAGQEEEIAVSEAEAALTDPAEAARFAAETGVDALAVAVGTVHGFYRWEPKLAHDRIAAIRKAAGVPLVLHGGSGVPDEEVQRAIQLGIRKVNISTEAKWAWAQALRQSLADRPDEFDPRPLLTPVMQAVQEVVRAKIRMVGANGKA
ncbi:class II fructose-bisphosphate aldolase [Symbiobacterium terraclitae]|uniref:class II fructose-bisphosphate aldolase n=1 Tax=Symbiobacterium terraclitae TaxID=557451 RepID=UPI0035B51CAA